MTKKFYVYKHLTADAREVFYVGKGVSRRVKSIRRNKKHTNIAKKHGVIVEVVFETFDEQEAFAKEIELIAECHTYVHDPEANHLASNMTIGGEGPSGVVRSEETRAKMKAAIKTAHSTPEVRKRKSESAKKRHAIERAAREANPEYDRQRHEEISAAIKTAHSAPEVRKRKSESGKKRYEDPAERQKTRDAAIQRGVIERERRAADPEYDKERHEKLSASQNTPEYRAKCSESAKKRRARERAERESDPQKMQEYLIKRAEAGRKRSETCRLKRLNKLQQLGTS